MIKERAWPAKAMYILIAAALAISLMIMAAPAQKVSAAPGLSEWTRVNTPTVEGFVLAPESTIVDFAIGDGGDVAYAIVYEDYDCPEEEEEGPGYLLKSTDGAATWEDITEAVTKEVDDEIGKNTTFYFVAVATDGEDADFVAVALDIFEGSLHVFISDDGGDTFVDTGVVADGGFELPANRVFAFAVSPEVGDERDIAIGGANYTPAALIFRCTVEGDSPDNWEDARYKGWDDTEDGAPDDLGAFFSAAVVEIQFSPSWATDKRTVLAVTVDNYNTNSGQWGPPGSVYLQSGSWGITPSWNAKASYPESVLIAPDVYIPPIGGAVAGIALPEDYDGTDTSSRILWVWVNYCTDNSPWFDDGDQECQIYRVADDVVDDNGPQGQIHNGDFWLTNVSYKGTIDQGEAIAGVLGIGYIETDTLSTECCDGVQVYRNDGIRNMIICCEPWDKACKPPTGRTAMEVVYVGEDKAYAVAVESGLHPNFFWLQGDPDYDESAWSVTFDDGDTWNQLSLIDTSIHYFSDVAVSPDCNKTMLVSVSKVEINCGCDSVWLHADTLHEAEEYSGKWLRTWCGELLGEDDEGYEHGILRLAPEEEEGTEVKTVYLVDLGTDNVYWNDLETLGCWKLRAATVDDIADLAVQDADTLFALDYDGHVAMFDDGEWHEEVDSEVDDGWTIAVWGDHILVGGQDGEVSYSDDGGETFALLEEVPTFDGYVTVAFDTYFDTNMTIYAAVAWADDNDDNGIYSWVIGADVEEWMDLKAEPLESQIGLPLDTVGMGGINATDDTVEVNFTGLVVDRPGNPYTSPENGGVIYASYEYDDDCTWVTGAARSLERDVTVCTTCLMWDFLHMGLTIDEEDFWAYPDALKICGCLSPDTNSHLFAIDWNDYDICENDYGSVWTYEDCYAKKAPEITSPADGAVIPADPCSCYSVPFTVLWDAICDACSFDIAFALDKDFEMPVKVNGEKGEVYHIISDTPSFSVMGGEAGGLSCETTYYVKIRAADAATDEIIHSWWSEAIAITIAPSVESGIITLVSPAPGALNQPIKNVGFSWDLLATADAFDWVLSANADLSSPLDSKTGLTSKATAYMGTLEHGTTYYWQVTAYNEGAMLGMSAVGTFTTGATGSFCDPVDGMCFDTQAELQAHQDAREAPGTPFWVWVVIAIGAVLVIVVIVLIFRTRRV